MKHFAYVLYVGFHANRNLCDKQNVLVYGGTMISGFLTVYDSYLGLIVTSPRTLPSSTNKV